MLTSTMHYVCQPDHNNWAMEHCTIMPDTNAIVQTSKLELDQQYLHTYSRKTRTTKTKNSCPHPLAKFKLHMFAKLLSFPLVGSKSLQIRSARRSRFGNNRNAKSSSQIHTQILILQKMHKTKNCQIETMIETVQFNKPGHNNTCPRRLRHKYEEQLCNKSTQIKISYSKSTQNKQLQNRGND